MTKNNSHSRITVFNHKGGVGKTTLTLNIASALAERGHVVLLVDSDPQCNLTSYLVDSDVLDGFLDRSDGPMGRTIWSAVKPIHEALGSFREIEPLETAVANLHIIPGDIRLSEYENDLAGFWGECFQRKARGFRGTTAISELVSATANRIGADIVFYDSGPNIGPLNRCVLLDCDYFIIPVACDLFSLRALKTLGITLTDWIEEWESISALAPLQTYLLRGKPSFLGYIPQGYHVYRGIATEQSKFLGKIQREIQSQIVSRLRSIDPRLVTNKESLGEVKYLGELATVSQSQGLPMSQITHPKSNDAKKTFAAIARNIESRLGGK
jgi:cellulose biosynthesis protein BcsQ